MKNIWQKISYLGIAGESPSLHTRAIKLANQVNFVLGVLTLILFVLTAYITVKNNQEFTFFTTRIFLLSIVNIANLVLSKYGFRRTVQLSTSLSPVSILIVIPMLFGYVQGSSFFYYHLVVLGLSLIPQVVFIPRKDNYVYWTSLIGFALIMLFLDDMMVAFAQSEGTIVNALSSFRIYFKIVPFIVFLFLHISLFHMRRVNMDYAQDLHNSNEELKKRLEELHRTQNHLIQSEKLASMGTMVAGIAHEINNPLNYIKGGIDLIDREQKEDDIDLEAIIDALGMIKEGSQRATRITSAMTTISYHNSTKRQDTSLPTLIDNTLIFLKSKLSKVQVLTEYNYREPLPIYAEKMHQVLINLIDNALYEVNRQTRSGNSWIKFQTTHASIGGKDHAVLRVFNSGDPIPEKILNSIFDPFYTTKDPGEGTGLGLSISFKLIEEHGGMLEAENLEDCVSFSISIPILSEEEIIQEEYDQVGKRETQHA
ncbi:MAG: hypothetical protein JXQ90_13490 [Cyclobacteriaceae bacterium]